MLVTYFNEIEKVKNVEESFLKNLHLNCKVNEVKDNKICNVIKGFLTCRNIPCGDHALRCVCPFVTDKER